MDYLNFGGRIISMPWVLDVVLILETTGMYELNLLKRKLRCWEVSLLVRSYVTHILTWEG